MSRADYFRYSGAYQSGIFPETSRSNAVKSARRKVKIVVTVPLENADETRRVLGEAGASVQGEYSFCSFSVVGKGRFLPSDKANPHIGEPGQPEIVEEERVEVVCEREIAKSVIAKLRAAHPYEEPAIDIYELLSEEEL